MINTMYNLNRLFDNKIKFYMWKIINIRKK